VAGGGAIGAMGATAREGVAGAGSCTAALGHVVFDGRLRRAKPALCFLHRCRARIPATAGLGHLIGGHKLTIHEALDTVQVVLGVVSLGLELGDHRFCGSPLLTTAGSSSCRCRQACLAASNLGVGGGDHLSLSVDFFHRER